MLSLYRTLSLRYLSRRWFRALLVVASIMLGVATLVATQALSETMSRATLASGNPMAGTIDLIVTNGDLPIDRSLANDLRKSPGVKKVHPRIFDQAKILIGAEKPLPVMVMGIELSMDMKEFDDLKDQFELSKTTLADYGLAIQQDKIPAILGKELDDELAKYKGALKIHKMSFFGVKTELTLLTLKKGQEEHVVARAGTIAIKDGAPDKDKFAAFAGHVVILDLDNAAKVLGIPKGKVRRIDIALQPGVDPKKARTEIEKILAGRAEVRTMEEQNQSLQSAMVGMKTGFSMCGVSVLIVGMFLVFNALSVSVQERRHEIGILLALGATRDQVWRLFAGEALFLGTLGSLFGIPLGMGFAYIGLEPTQDMGDLFAATNVQPIHIGWELVLLAVGVGNLSALIASLVPAILASQESPAEAVRRVPKEPPVSHLVLHIVATCLLVLGGMGMILIRDHLFKRWGTYGGLILVMTGALLAAPLIAQIGARGLVPISRRFFPVEWRIAADNLVRSPGRTGMVIGALAAGVCLIVETAGIIRSNRLAIKEWVETSIAADIVVTSGSPVGSGGQNIRMEENLGDELRKLPEIRDVLPNRLCTEVLFRDVNIAVLTTVADRAYGLEKERLATLTTLDPQQRANREKEIELLKTLDEETNAVILSGNFAALYHVHKGDLITLKSPRGEVKFHVIGTTVDYTWNLGTIIMNRRDYVDHWEDTSVTLFEVYLKPNVDPKVAKDNISAKLGAQYDLHPLTRTELQAHADEMIERLYRLLLGQEIVVVIVAMLGVIMALLISVLQRRREMGLLRAIGASQAQVVYLVLAEAALMGVFGSLLGVIFAIPLQWYALQVVFLEEAGHMFPVYLPRGEAAVIALAAIAIATLAGVGPALYAVRERIPDAISYE